VHSSEDYDLAVSASEILFGKSTDEDLKKLDEATLLDIFEGVPQGVISKGELEVGKSIAEVLVQSGFVGSNGEAKRALQEGSISVNKVKSDALRMINTSDILNGNLILLQRGKKNYFLIKTE
jgi:tyrosyl-tRNA synthetase